MTLHPVRVAIDASRRSVCIACPTHQYIRFAILIASVMIIVNAHRPTDNIVLVFDGRFAAPGFRYLFVCHIQKMTRSGR